jgi:hypothetical protein
MHYTSLKRNLFAIPKKEVTKEGMEQLLPIISQGHIKDDGFFYYVSDIKLIRSVEPEKDLFILDNQTKPICHGCEDRVKFATQQKVCKPCYFKPSKHYKHLRFNEKQIRNKLEELGFSYVEPQALYDEVFPKSSLLKDSFLMIDKEKVSSLGLINKNQYIDFPYWRFGSTGNFLEHVTIHFSYNEKTTENVPFLLLDTTEQARKGGKVLFFRLNNLNEAPVILNDFARRLKPFLYDRSIDQTSFPISFYSNGTRTDVYQTIIHSTTDMKLAIEDEYNRYYEKDNGLYKKLSLGLDSFLKQYTESFVLNTSSGHHELLYDGQYLYERYGSIEDVHFIMNYNSSISMIFHKVSYGKCVKTIREVIENFPDLALERIPKVYVKELIGEPTLSVEEGDAVCIVSPSEKNKKLLNAKGTVLEVKNDDVIVGFLNNHFTEKLHQKELIKYGQKKPC